MGEQNDIPVQNTDELDDVEGHGLREVAAAAGIGAAVLGAGGVAFAASASHSDPVPAMIKPPSIVAQTQNDARQLITDATGGAGGVANQTLDDTKALAGHALAQVNSTLAPVVTTASNTVQGTENLATQTVNDTTTLANHEVTAATTLVNQTEQSALDTVASTEHTAFTTADNVLNKATTKVTTVESTALSVVNATLDKVGQGWTLDVAVLGDHVQTGGNMLTPSGIVTVTDSDGHTLGSANVANGTATVSFNAAGYSGHYTIHYAGNLPSASIAWLAPTL